ncbi:MAG: DUF433 domain-containing protein [Lamprocystis purpurea]|nr:DUF433 domain-containing protein [Lamprocystis purpurea]
MDTGDGVSTPDIMMGNPTIAGTRVTVESILERSDPRQKARPDSTSLYPAHRTRTQSTSPGVRGSNAGSSEGISRPSRLRQMHAGVVDRRIGCPPKPSGIHTCPSSIAPSASC